MIGQMQEMGEVIKSLTLCQAPPLPAQPLPPILEVPPTPQAIVRDLNAAGTSMAVAPEATSIQAPRPILAAQVVVQAEGYEQYEDQTLADRAEERLSSKLHSLEQSMREIRGTNMYRGTSYSDLSLFPDVQLPLKFKMPEFTKYNGTGCLYIHLKIYCGELGRPGQNERLRIQLFQRSVTGPALTWFIKNSTQFKTWDILTSLLLDQYKFNTEAAPDRLTLRRMSRKSSESFREYAQRWRETAAQVTPAMDEREMMNSFLPTLSPFQFTALFSCVDRSFSDLIRKEEMLEEGIRLGRIKALEDPSTSNAYGRSSQSRSDEEELPVSAVILGQSSLSRLPLKQRSRPFPSRVARLIPDPPGVEQKKKRVFTPLGYSLSQAFDHLMTASNL
uniref:Retrotransposon gag domain-containing protein n=1 Tax=Davidia involucrata TaxID=16924 RepID=A0A5B6Z857_DAVIN